MASWIAHAVLADGLLAREPAFEAGEGFPFFLPREYEGFLARAEERVWTGICGL